MGFNGNSVPNFVQSVIENTSVAPGYNYPNTTGTCSIICQKRCIDAACSKRTTAHKSPQGLHFETSPDWLFDQYLVDSVNLFTESIRCCQAVLQTFHIFLNEIPMPTEAAYEIGGYRFWKKFQFRLTGTGSGYLTGEWDVGNDPADAEFYNNVHGSLCAGFLYITNSKLEQASFVIYSVTSEDNGTMRFYSATPVPTGSLLYTAANGGNPVLAEFVSFTPACMPIWTETNRIIPLYCAPETVTLSSFIAGENVLFSNMRCALNMPAQAVVRKQIGGVWSECALYPRNYWRSGQWKVVLDLTGLDLTGITAFEIDVQKETAPIPDTLEQVIAEINDPTAAVTVIAADTVAVGDATFQYSVAGEYFDWWPTVQIYNSLGSVLMDLTEQNLYHTPDEGDPIPFDSIVATFNKFVAPGNSVQYFGQDRCINAKEDFTGKKGVLDTVLNKRFWCYYWDSLSAGEKAIFTACQGKCLNSECQYLSLNMNNYDFITALDGVLRSRLFKREQQNALESNSWQTFANGAPSIESLAGDLLQAAGTRYKGIEWDYASEVYMGTLDHPEYLAYYDEEEPPNPVMLATAIVKRTGLEYIPGTNDTGFASKVPITQGIAGKHVYTGAIRGTHFRKLDYRDAYVNFPLVAAGTAWQHFLDGDFRYGFWDADLNEQLTSDENTVYYMMVKLVNGRRTFKTTTPCETNIVTTCQIFDALGGGKFALKHKTINLLKPRTVTEEDEPVARKIGNTNVLFDSQNRTTNAECDTSIVGAGDDKNYIYAGMCLEVPNDARIDAKYVGRRIPITATTPCDATGLEDTDFDASSLAGIMGLPSTDILKYCDTITVDDSEGNTLAGIALTVDLNTITFNVVDGPWATGAGTWWKSSPSISDSAIADVKALYSSGMFYFPVACTPTTECLVGKIPLVYRGSVPSVLNDLNPIIQTLQNVVGGSFNFSFSDSQNHNPDARTYLMNTRHGVDGALLSLYSSSVITDPPSSRCYLGSMYDFLWSVPIGGGPWQIEVNTEYSNIIHPFCSEMLFRAPITSAMVSAAEINLALRCAVVTTTQSTENGVDYTTSVSEEIVPPSNVTLYGVTYSGSTPTYTPIAQADGTHGSGNGFIHWYSATNLVKGYLNNKGLYESFVLVPYLAGWSLPTGYGSLSWLAGILKNSFEAQAHYDPLYDAVVGSWTGKHIEWNFITGVGGVCTINSAQYNLYSDNRVYYKMPPGGVR